MSNTARVSSGSLAGYGLLLDARHRGDGPGGGERQHLHRRAAAGRRPGDAAPLRRPRDVGGLELEQRRLVRLEVAQARDGRQLVGVRHADDRAGLAGGEGAQADPVGQVRLEPAQPALLEPLRRQQQVHRQRPAEAPDGDEEVGELGLGREQLGELVGDDEQRRQRLEVGAPGPGLLVVGDVGEVAGRAQQLLAPGHLALQRVLHALDERELLAEVGDDRRDVRHVGHAGERRATLEVDEDEVELLGRVGHREREDERPQQLGLARAGGADDQPVRAHALLGGLLDVERDDLAAAAHPDRHPQPVPLEAGAPRRGRVEVAHVPEAEQVDELGAATSGRHGPRPRR